MVGIPLVILMLSPIIDGELGLPKLPDSCRIAGIILIIPGILFAAWSAFSQFRIGKGSPLPVVPSKRLVVKGPYAYCRNPMTFGAVTYYLGISLLAGSFSAIILVILFSLVFVAYIKLVEEKELEAKFGEEYRMYKRRTPFLVPKFWR